MDESVDLIVSDPPYLINYATNQNDSNPRLIEDYIEECYRSGPCV